MFFFLNKRPCYLNAHVEPTPPPNCGDFNKRLDIGLVIYCISVYRINVISQIHICMLLAQKVEGKEIFPTYIGFMSLRTDKKAYFIVSFGYRFQGGVKNREAFIIKISQFLGGVYLREALKEVRTFIRGF